MKKFIYQRIIFLIDLFIFLKKSDPEPIHDGVIPSGGNPVQRTKNLKIIVDNMKQFYEEELGHVILKLPDTKKLGTEPESHIGEMSLLLLLLLGCAVQCPNKEKFITKIKTLNVDTQLSIVDCIKKVIPFCILFSIYFVFLYFF